MDGAPRQQRISEASPLALQLQSTDSRVLAAAVQHPEMNEELALALLRRRDLPHGIVELLAENRGLLKSRKLLVALVQHPRTPRHVSVPLARQLFPFELMQLAITPGTPPDIKIVAEDFLLQKMESVSTGEKLTLAKRASGKIASALLLESEVRIVRAALNNPFLNENWLIRAIVHEQAPESLAALVCECDRWRFRREVQVALLRNAYLPLARAIEYAVQLPASVLYEILRHSRLELKVKEYLLHIVQERAKPKASSD